VRLHESMGFTVAGVIREGGYKFDRWLDVAFLQAAL
jgi:L-amino acid N-acyltransferase